MSTKLVSFLACISGKLLNGSSGFFSSPNFPISFPQYSRCTWIITVPSGYIIKVIFRHIQLGDRWSDGAQLSITNVSSGVVTLHGDSLPDPVYSVGNSIQVIFTSLNRQYSGFNAYYTAITFESRESYYWHQNFLSLPSYHLLWDSLHSASLPNALGSSAFFAAVKDFGPEIFSVKYYVQTLISKRNKFSFNTNYCLMPNTCNFN